MADPASVAAAQPRGRTRRVRPASGRGRGPARCRVGQTARATAEGDHRAWYVAFADDAPVGLVQGRRRRPGSLLLFSLWVAPEVRLRHVGARLIDALEDWARSWQATETILWVVHGNDAALAFYQRLGFGRLSEGPDADLGAQHGAVAFRRTIPMAD